MKKKLFSILLLTMAMFMLHTQYAQASVCPSGYGQGTTCFSPGYDPCDPTYSTYPCQFQQWDGAYWCCMVVDCNVNEDCGDGPYLCQWHTCYWDGLTADDEMVTSSPDVALICDIPLDLA